MSADDVRLRTYQHIDEVRKLLRVFAVELLARGETHDRSRLDAAEADLFAEHEARLRAAPYGSPAYEGVHALIRPAAIRHFRHNRHHPEHHEGGVDGMNLIDLVEMWIDWHCASRRHTDGSMARSIDVNETRYALSPQLARIFRKTLKDLESGTLSTNRTEE